MSIHRLRYQVAVCLCGCLSAAVSLRAEIDLHGAFFEGNETQDSLEAPYFGQRQTHTLPGLTCAYFFSQNTKSKIVLFDMYCKSNIFWMLIFPFHSERTRERETAVWQPQEHWPERLESLADCLHSARTESDQNLNLPTIQQTRFLLNRSVLWLKFLVWKQILKMSFSKWDGSALRDREFSHWSVLQEIWSIK